MRQYLFGTGLISAITGGLTLLRSLREKEPFTWRSALAWLSWGISLALAVGAVRDTRRAHRGKSIAPDSPVARAQRKRAQKRLKKRR